MTRSKTHKITSPAPKKSTRKTPRKRRSISLKKSYIIVFAVTPVLATTCLALAFHLNRPHVTPAADPADTKYYFANSKYHDITSKFVQRRNRAEQTSLEYPITKNQKINDTIAAAINEKDIAAIINKYKHVSIGAGMVLLDLVIVSCSYFIFQNVDKIVSEYSRGSGAYFFHYQDL